MATFLIALFSVVLVLVCLFVTLLVLMQKPSANSGMGAALGGGAAEQAFGGEATNVLTRGTIYSIIAFFVLCFGLYLGTLATNNQTGPASEGASISKLTEGKAAAANATEEIEETTLSVEEAPVEEESMTVAPADEVMEGVQESVEEGEDNASAAIEEKKEAAPIQLESLDSEPASSGS